MNYQIETAKNGEPTLQLNNIYIYSKYNPKDDASKFVKKEFDENANCYFIVGLGLGYHLEALLKLANNKRVIAFVVDKQELEIYKQFNSNLHLDGINNLEIILELDSEINLNDFQIIIPFSWMKAIGNNHRIQDVLEDIKIRQMSYNSLKDLLSSNFHKNILNNDVSLSVYKKAFIGDIACLVSAGPSLDKTIEELKNAKEKCFVLAVGSALNTLLKNNIYPDAVIITDSQINVVNQLENKGYKGLLFYLSTANHQMTLIHEGKRVIIFQEGYLNAELEAHNRNEDTIETGGSVATTGFSLLEYMGFNSVVLFGQDLGFKGESTHSNFSTSQKKVAKSVNYKKVLANNGEYIYTTSNLSTYHRWFERKVHKSKVEILNMSWEGAKIEGAPFLGTVKLNKKLNNLVQKRNF